MKLRRLDRLVLDAINTQAPCTGAQVIDYVRARVWMPFTFSAVYLSLHRLENAGILKATRHEGGPARGGRAFYTYERLDA